MRYILRAFIFLSALFLFFSHAVADVHDKFSSVKIYYYGWDVLTRVRLSLDAVRKGAPVTITISDPARASSFYNWLNIDNMELQKEPYQEDPRLVIDFLSTEGKTISYYASRFNLCSSNSERKRNIDDAFRARFQFGEEQYERR